MIINKRIDNFRIDNDVAIFYGMILGSALSFIFFGLPAFVIGGILVSIYLLIDYMK